uniref:AlNc14C400G11356 protein n=1 Tax=Albugo laibachii Nc14 TaxID=890382 RepID=F0WYU6_9STRA|nr:AlNc14C400G11356 [Albugo laibachii Nc14]|eukprot:CCA26655.1 AlNc14C400G11356 [Albugo laibachii Nc14]
MKNVYAEKQFRAHSLSLLVALFGLILTASLIPLILALVLKVFLLLLVILLAAVITNPDEDSFSMWLKKKKSDSDQSWLTSIINSAVSLAVSSSQCWDSYNFVFFTIMDVPSMKRQAFGAFGKWVWTDTCPTIAQFSEWIVETTTEGSLYTYITEQWQKNWKLYRSKSFAKESTTGQRRKRKGTHYD